MAQKYQAEMIESPADREKIAREILLQLPDWFGLPDSTQEYIQTCRSLPFWAILEGQKPLGFLALKETSPQTAELYVMGVCPQKHKQGLGRTLFQAFCSYCQRKGYLFIQVKTVKKGCYPVYDKTNAFYEAMGFIPLECIPDLWGPANPCQIYIMAVPK